MFAPRTEMQKSPSSIEALSIQEAVTLEDVLHNDGAASVLIQFLDRWHKRNLRLVCHAGKDAVDKTVTSVWTSGMGPPSRYRRITPRMDPDIYIEYACILSNSNWKGIKSLGYSSWQCTATKAFYEPEGLTQLAEAGLSKLESLKLRFCKEDANSADKLVKAGWKLKKLGITGSRIAIEWFGPLVRDANWPLEELTIAQCTASIAELIAVSQWKLKKLYLNKSDETLSPEGVETLMQGSWVSTVERLYLSFRADSDKKGIRAISQASHKAMNLLELSIVPSVSDNKDDALILAEGSYPNLKKLSTQMRLRVSGVAAILRKCPKLERFTFNITENTGAVDPEDAKLVAEHYKNGTLHLHDFKSNVLEAQLAGYL